MLLLLPMISFACALLTRRQPAQPTLESEPYFGSDAGELAIEPLSMPEAKKGVVYKVEIRISQNETPVGDITITKGALPTGLMLDFLDGEDAALISGVPEESGTFPFIIYAWCFGTQVSGQVLEKEYQIVVGE